MTQHSTHSPEGAVCGVGAVSVQLSIDCFVQHAGQGQALLQGQLVRRA